MHKKQDYLNLTRNMSRKMVVSRMLLVEESIGDLRLKLTHCCQGHFILLFFSLSLFTATFSSSRFSIEFFTVTFNSSFVTLLFNWTFHSHQLILCLHKSSHQNPRQSSYVKMVIKVHISTPPWSPSHENLPFFVL